MDKGLLIGALAIVAIVVITMAIVTVAPYVAVLLVLAYFVMKTPESHDSDKKDPPQ